MRHCSKKISQIHTYTSHTTHPHTRSSRRGIPSLMDGWVIIRNLYCLPCGGSIRRFNRFRSCVDLTLEWMILGLLILTVLHHCHQPTVTPLVGIHNNTACKQLDGLALSLPPCNCKHGCSRNLLKAGTVLFVRIPQIFMLLMQKNASTLDLQRREWTLSDIFKQRGLFTRWRTEEQTQGALFYHFHLCTVHVGGG